MRVPVDECLPRRLVGELLRLAEGRCDVFLAIDKSVVHQQHLTGRQLAVIVIVARSNRFETLSPLLPEVLDRLREIGPGEVLRVGG